MSRVPCSGRVFLITKPNNPFAMSIFLYACETWALTAELQRRVQTMEMRCYRNILCISYKDHVTNEEVHNIIQQAIGPYEDLLTTVKKRKLKWYGYVSGLTKIILQGTVRGARRRGRQRKRREDNIREWTGLDFSDTQRAADERQRWRQLVARSSVVPQRHSGLRDWWWWWDVYKGYTWRIVQYSVSVL